MSSCNVTASSILQCENAIDAVINGMREDNAAYSLYVQRLQEYNIAHQEWVNAKREQDRIREERKTAPAGRIWYGNLLYNCEDRGACWWGTSGLPQPKNCNSCNEVQRRCKACRYPSVKPTCSCTAGLGGSCHQPCSEFTYNTVSSYERTYQQWLVDNPEPTEPAVYIRRTSWPNILCQACTQCIEFGQINGDLSASNINQYQDCTATMRDKLAESGDGDSLPPPPSPSPSTKWDELKVKWGTNAPIPLGKIPLLAIFGILLLIIVTIVGVVIALMVRGKKVAPNEKINV